MSIEMNHLIIVRKKIKYEWGTKAAGSLYMGYFFFFFLLWSGVEAIKFSVEYIFFLSAPKNFNATRIIDIHNHI